MCAHGFTHMHGGIQRIEAGDGDHEMVWGELVVVESERGAEGVAVSRVPRTPPKVPHTHTHTHTQRTLRGGCEHEKAIRVLPGAQIANICAPANTADQR